MWWRECRRDGTGFCSTEAIFPRHGRPHPQLPSLGGVQDERATTGLTLVGVPARVGACIWKRHMSHPPWAASCSVLNKLPFVPSSMMYPEEPEYTPQAKRHPASFCGRANSLFPESSPCRKTVPRLPRTSPILPPVRRTRRAGGGTLPF